MRGALALVVASAIGCGAASPHEERLTVCMTVADHDAAFERRLGAPDQELELSIRQVASGEPSRTVDVWLRNRGPRPRWVAIEDEDPLAYTAPDVSLLWAPADGDQQGGATMCSTPAWPVSVACGDAVETPLADRAVLLVPGQERVIGRYELRADEVPRAGRLSAYYVLRDGCAQPSAEPSEDVSSDHPICGERAWVRSAAVEISGR